MSFENCTAIILLVAIASTVFYIVTDQAKQNVYNRITGSKKLDSLLGEYGYQIQKISKANDRNYLLLIVKRGQVVIQVNEDYIGIEIGSFKNNIDLLIDLHKKGDTANCQKLLDQMFELCCDHINKSSEIEKGKFY